MAKLFSLARNAAAAIAVGVLLTGCLVPETIVASIVLEGYKYDMRVEARLADPRVVKALADGHVLTEQEEDRMRAEERKAARMPGFESFTYGGKGRFDLVVNLTGELDASGSAIGVPNTRAKSQAANFLSIRRMDDGTIEVSTPEIPDRARADLDQLGIVPSGTVTVTVSGKVIETNASETPGLFFGGAYRWNISSWDDRVFLKVDPAVD
ncbi:hypothetical protein FY036_01535 [Mesorhizobium microcysteis]|uniref:Uncharacterized protein n=1 Tax=Neoaquamicrobium microcysteis TaxID=2682781 RepID=A0A5D4H739_9HYPH|nr:hypothetical protein [Mesorhizobium microcysteis]TYR36073.1 hypothetical protein FY036_01535 [Mesorhizobium microcysteis]